jgi:hypothetical protein
VLLKRIIWERRRRRRWWWRICNQDQSAQIALLWVDAVAVDAAAAVV